MIENTLDNIPGITQRFNGRKTGKKTRRKPLSLTRATYEENFPPLGVRISRGSKMQLYIDAKAAKMDFGEYIESLVEKNHKYIESIQNEWLQKGKDSRQADVDAAFNAGKAQGTSENVDRAWREGKKVGEENTAIFFYCSNYHQGCREHIPLKRGTWLANVAIDAIYRYRNLCPNCQYNEIMGRNEQSAPGQTGPVWYP